MIKQHMKNAQLTIPGHKGNANQNHIKIPGAGRVAQVLRALA
jgi:hypothetical protein